MRISFLVNYDAPALLALNYLLPALSSHELSVFYTHKEIQSKDYTKAKTMLDQLTLFDRQLVESAKVPIQFNAPHFQKANQINTRDYPALASTKPDLIISIRHMTILRDAVIALPVHGVINLHSGLLPAYQGVMASFRAMLNKEAKLGTCLHYIEDTGIDTGKIIEQSKVSADYTRSYLWNVLKLYRSGSNTILEAIDSLDQNQPLNSCQQSGEPHYYSYPSEQELLNAEFKLFELGDNIDDLLEP